MLKSSIWPAAAVLTMILLILAVPAFASTSGTLNCASQVDGPQVLPVNRLRIDFSSPGDQEPDKALPVTGTFYYSHHIAALWFDSHSGAIRGELQPPNSFYAALDVKLIQDGYPFGRLFWMRGSNRATLEITDPDLLGTEELQCKTTPDP